jgi:hypothetical protein
MREDQGIAGASGAGFSQNTAGNYLQRRASVTAVYGEISAASVNKTLEEQPKKQLLEALDRRCSNAGAVVVVESQSDTSLQQMAPPGMRGAAARRGSVAVEQRKTSVSAKSVMSAGAQRRASIQVPLFCFKDFVSLLFLFNSYENLFPLT